MIGIATDDVNKAVLTLNFDFLGSITVTGLTTMVFRSLAGTQGMMVNIITITKGEKLRGIYNFNPN